MSEFVDLSTLHPVEQLRCDGAPFGHEIARDMSDGRGITRGVLARIAVLRTGISNLIGSHDPGDRFAASIIESRFRTDDQEVFNSTLHEGKIKDGESILRWLIGVDDETFVKFAHWNVERHRALKHQLAEDHDELMALSVAKTQELIDMGLFPKMTLESILRTALTHDKFAAMDSFEAGAVTGKAYFDGETIFISNLYKNRTDHWGVGEQLKKTTFHEVLHATGEVTKAGFYFEQHTPLFSLLLEEALVTHSTEVAFANNERKAPHIVNPPDRHEHIHTPYAAERKILSHLISPEVANIPIELLADAFFSDQTSPARKEVTRRLQKGFTYLYGSVDAFIDFNERYHSAQEKNDIIVKERLFEEFRRRIEAAHDQVDALGVQIPA